MQVLAHAMVLNHLSFPSRDVAATAAFFEHQLGCTVVRMGTSRLAKRPGFDIVIEDASDRRVAWPDNFHVGFELDSLSSVRETYRRFVAEGVTMKTEVFHHPRGSRFFCEAPGGLMFEINTRADAAEEFRGTFDSQRSTVEGKNRPSTTARVNPDQRTDTRRTVERPVRPG